MYIDRPFLRRPTHTPLATLLRSGDIPTVNATAAKMMDLMMLVRFISRFPFSCSDHFPMPALVRTNAAAKTIMFVRTANFICRSPFLWRMYVYEVNQPVNCRPPPSIMLYLCR